MAASLQKPGKSTRIWWSGLLLCAIYLCLLGTIPFKEIPGSLHDDELFLTQAAAIADGQWLGPYGPLTLAKGPLLSLLMAGPMALKWPVALSLRALYALCCWWSCCLVLPMRPSWLRWLALALLLCDPWMLTAPGSRFTRVVVFSPLFLLSLSMAVAALERQRRRWLWGSSLGFGLLMICREGRIGLVVVAVLLVVLWFRRQGVRQHLWSGALAFTLFWIPVASLQGVHALRYGAPISNELEEGAFKQFYATLVGLNIPDLKAKPFVPIRTEVIQQVIKVAPESQLAHVLQALDPSWTTIGCRQHPSSCGHYGGGWFLWALRDAMHRVDPTASARKFQAFNAELAAEAQQLCHHHPSMLECRRRSIGFLPWLPGRGEALPWWLLLTEIGHKSAGLLIPAAVDRKPVTLPALTPKVLQTMPPVWRKAGVQVRHVAETAGYNQRMIAATGLGIAGRLLLAIGAVAAALTVPRTERWGSSSALIAAAIFIQLLLIICVELTSFRSNQYLVMLSPSLTLLLCMQIREQQQHPRPLKKRKAKL